MQRFACNIGFSKYNPIERANRFLDTSLAMAAIHAVHAICLRYRLGVFVMMFMMAVFTMFVASTRVAAFAVIVIIFARVRAHAGIAAATAATAMTVTALMCKLCVQHKCSQESRANVIEHA